MLARTCRYLLPGLSAVWLAGCTTLARVDGAEEPTGWIAYSNFVRAVDPLELERRFDSAVRMHAETPSNATAIRLAVLVSDARGAFYDPQRALGLLDGVAASAGDASSDVEFARFLRNVLVELAAERAERQTLEQQLDALKALEQRLNADELER